MTEEENQGSGEMTKDVSAVIRDTRMFEPKTPREMYATFHDDLATMPSRSHVASSPASAAPAGVKDAPQRPPRSNHQHANASGRNRPPPSVSRSAPFGKNAAARASAESPIVIDGPSGRVACIADVRGNMSLFNQIAQETGAQAIIHTGDFGFYERASFDRISDRTLRHLVQYSSLISSSLRASLLTSAPEQPLSLRERVMQHPGPLLSEFTDLLTGQMSLNVPVFTVWGACEDVAIIERFRTGEYQVKNLFVLDEATSKSIEVGGIRLRLFGLGGAVVPHKLFDNGEGAATIAGGQGTMWTTALQIGQLVDTAQKSFDPTETRLLITHASPGREGLLAQLALALKADLTVSAGLHFRYGSSYNEFSVQHDAENFRNKLQHAKTAFSEIWDTVKAQVDAVIDQDQRILLNNALAVANRVPPSATGAVSEELAWKNTWNWNLPDAAYGNLVLAIKDGRVGAETKSHGFNFAYRRSNQPIVALTPVPQVAPAPTAALAPAPLAVATQAPTSLAAPTRTAPPHAAAPAGAVARPIERSTPAKPTAPVAPVTPAVPVATPAPVTSVTPAPITPVKAAKDAREKKTKVADPSNTRSDVEGTSGTDGRKSPSGPRAGKARNPFTLYISQLKEALPVSEEEIRNYFGPAAAGIAGIKLVYDKPHRRTTSSGKEEPEQPRRQRPFAYVEFKDASAMEHGLQRQGEVIKDNVKPVLEHADSNKTVQADSSTTLKKERPTTATTPTASKRKDRAVPSLPSENDRDTDSAREQRPARNTNGKASTPTTPATSSRFQKPAASSRDSTSTPNQRPTTTPRSAKKGPGGKSNPTTPAKSNGSHKTEDRTTPVPPLPTTTTTAAVADRIPAEQGW